MLVMRRHRPAGPRLGATLGDAFLAGLVVHRGDEVAQLGNRIFAVPDWLLLGMSG